MCKKVFQMTLEKGIELMDQGFRLILHKFLINGKNSKLFVAFIICSLKFSSLENILSIGRSLLLILLGQS